MDGEDRARRERETGNSEGNGTGKRMDANVFVADIF